MNERSESVEREEKLQELELLFQRLSSVRTPNYHEVLKKACILYRELYVLPWFENANIQIPPMVFVEKGMPETTVARYNATDRVIEINSRMMFLLMGKDKVDGSFMFLNSIGHEYRHALQHEVAKLFMRDDLAAIDKIEDKQLVSAGKSFINVLKGKVIYDNKEDIKLLFKFFPRLFQDIEAMCDNEDKFDDIVKIAADAMYYKEEIERDARSQGRNLLGQCMDELGQLHTEGKKDYLKKIKQVIDDDLTTEKENNRELLPIVKKIEGTIAKLGNATFEDFGMKLYKGKIKGLRAYQEGKGQELYQASENKKALLKKLVNFYVHKKLALYDEKQRKTAQDQLFSALIKKGLLLERGFLSEVELLEKISSYNFYYQVLKQEEVSKNSFDLIRTIDRYQANDLIISYLQKGQMEFVEEILERLDKREVESFLYYSTCGFRKGVESGDIVRPGDEPLEIMEQDLLGQLAKIYTDLSNKQKEGKVLFDEINDFYVVLLKICDIIGLDNSNKEYILGSEIEKEMKLWLMDLKSRTEKLALKQIELMLGYQPTKEEFSIDNVEDRQRFLLKGKNKELLIKNIYGNSEYKRVVAEREANEEYMEETQ